MFKIKEKKVNEYIAFIERNIKDIYMREKIITKIRFFLLNGKIVFDGNNLYGKMNHNGVTDYLEIRYENYNIICNFTEEIIGKHVNIIQSSLKGGNTKIVETDKFERKTCNNHNKTEIHEEEKIFNYHDRLIFESNLKREASYDTFDNYDSNIIYNESKYVENFLELNKQWYISDTVDIKYNLFKNFIGGSELKENYLLSYHSTVNKNLRQEVVLDKQIFEDFMTAKITYEELLDKTLAKELSDEEKSKELKKINK